MPERSPLDSPRRAFPPLHSPRAGCTVQRYTVMPCSTARPPPAPDLVSDLWEHPGFHCGDCMEVLVDGEWVPTRIEMDSGLWYLVDTPYKGDLEYVRARILD